MNQEQYYWRNRVLAETSAALHSADIHAAALHVDIAARCVDKFNEARIAWRSAGNRRIAH
jgi:hypothetical protein